MRRSKAPKIVLNYLRDNPEMTHVDASRNLSLQGFSLSAKQVTKLRSDNNIPYVPKRTLIERFKDDLKQGIEFNTVNDIVLRYDISRNYAVQLFNVKNKKADPVRKNKVKQKSAVIDLEPVIVNTMAHAVQQLTVKESFIGVG